MHEGTDERWLQDIGCVGKTVTPSSPGRYAPDDPQTNCSQTNFLRIETHSALPVCWGDFTPEA